MSTAERTTTLIDGMRLSRDEFLRRWDQLPEVKFAELIDGVVRLPSPLSLEHGDIDNLLAWWTRTYAFETPGTKSSSNATWLMGEDAPQPDQSLRLLPEYGGQSSLRGRLAFGAPELAIEVSFASTPIDLHEKYRLYESSGVQEYLVVLVQSREVRWHHLEGDSYRLLEMDGEGLLCSVVFPGLWLDAAALFNEDEDRFQSVTRDGLASPEHGTFVEWLRTRRES